MPEALLLALPIVGGFLAVTSLYNQRYRIARDSGYRLYFKIVHFAILLSAIALLSIQVTWFVSAMIGLNSSGGSSELKAEVWKGAFWTLQGSAGQLAVLAFGLGSLVHLVFNTSTAKQKAIERAIADEDFELMVEKSQREDKPILITLDTGKVYVGWAVRGPIPTRQRNWIRILPLASGYRDANQKVRLTVPYATILAKLRDDDEEFLSKVSPDVQVEDFEVVISIENIVAMHLFDIGVYTIFDSDGANLFYQT